MIYGDYLSNPYGALGNAAPSAMFKQFTEQQLKDDYPRSITYEIFSIEKTIRLSYMHIFPLELSRE